MVDSPVRPRQPRMVESSRDALALADLLERAARMLREGPGMTMVGEELVTLTEAAERLSQEQDVDAKTLRARFEKWVHSSRGYLRVVDKVHGSAPGGVARVRLSDVRALLDNPPKEGRPPKNGHAA